MLRVDAHHHFWDPARADYPWMTAALAPLRRAFGPSDLGALLDSRAIDRSIVVQTRSSIAESHELLAVAEQTPFVGGVVGWVDLTSADVGVQIASLRGAPGGGALVGIRHQVHDEADPMWLMRDDVRRGLAAVDAAGLAFDLLVRERELTAACDAVARFPRLRFILDHIAKPPIASGTIPTGWLAGIQLLGQARNVTCKLSGMVTEANWSHWTRDDLRPYIAHVIDAFGPSRLMFGSDWPVCLLAAPYGLVHDTLRGLLTELIPDRTRVEDIFGTNAADTYRIGQG